jgi:hypothetical protein
VYENLLKIEIIRVIAIKTLSPSRLFSGIESYSDVDDRNLGTTRKRDFERSFGLLCIIAEQVSPLFVCNELIRVPSN